MTACRTLLTHCMMGLLFFVSVLLHGCGGGGESGLGVPAETPSSFVADWRFWRTEMPLPKSGGPFAASKTTLYDADPDLHWIMAQALGDLSDFAPQTSEPDLLLDAACDGFTSATTRFFCKNVLTPSTVASQCGGLVLNGQTLCEILADLKLPARTGLEARIDYFDRTATLKGTLDGYTVDLRLTPGESTDQQIRMVLSGSIGNAAHQWQFGESSVQFDYASKISSSNVNKPTTVTGLLAYTLGGAAGLSGNFRSTLNFTFADMDALTPPISLYDALGRVNLSATTTGTLAASTANGEASMSLTGGGSPLIRVTRNLVPVSTGTQAQVTLESTPARWKSGLVKATIAWDRRVLSGDYTSAGVEISNALNLRLVMPDGSGNGTLYEGRTARGRIVYKAELPWIRYEDGSEEML